MEKSHANRKSMGMCEKISKAIGISSASKHQILHRYRDHPVAETLPFVSDPRLQMPRASNNKNHRVGKLDPKTEIEVHIGPGKGEAYGGKGEGGKQPRPENIDDRASDFIRHAKMKLRSMSNVGPKRAASKVGRSSGMDHNSKFSEFINNTKMRMRATSNVGHGKSSPVTD